MGLPYMIRVILAEDTFILHGHSLASTENKLLLEAIIILKYIVNIHWKIFVIEQKSVKTAKVFSLKCFAVYGMYMYMLK